MNKMNKINKTLYYLLSFTWGLPMTLIGLIVAVFLLLIGLNPKRLGWCYYFEFGHYWGGLNLGIIFLCSKDSNSKDKKHEFGHSIQNCYFGFLMPFIISVPSAIRYWYRRWKKRCGVENLPHYDSIWFEGQATRLGIQVYRKYFS